MSKRFRILSIDGGGSRGIYAAGILAQLEEQYGPIHQYFDLITGASTGGLIALALGAGKSAKDILDLYINDIPEIFKKHFWQTAAQLFTGCKYTNKALRKTLDNFLGDMRLSDAVTRLCIPVVDLEACRPLIVRTPHYDPGAHYIDFKLTDVALATSAAPTFFPAVPLHGIGKKMIDGGVWESNPGFVGVFEAAKYFVSKKSAFTSIDLLSLGNMPAAPTGLKELSPNSSVLSWGDRLVSVPMAVQVEDAHRMLKVAETHDLFPIETYIRLENQSLDRSQRDSIPIDCSDINLLQLLHSKAIEDLNSAMKIHNFDIFFEHSTEKALFRS